MSESKKMTLVEKAVLDRYRQKQIAQSLFQPELTSMVSIQGKIEDILGNTTLADAEKVELLRRAQSKFESLKVTLHPAAVKDLASTPKPEEEAAPATGPDDIMGTVALPQQYSNKFNSFKRFLDAHPGLLDKNAQNEAVVDGRTIAGSNFDDLIHNLYVHKQSDNLTGVFDLTTALVKANLSHTLLSNHRFIDLMNPPPLVPPLASTSTTSLHSDQPPLLRVHAKRARSGSSHSRTPTKSTSKHKHAKKPEKYSWLSSAASILPFGSSTSHTDMPALEDDPEFSTPEVKQSGSGRHPPGKRPRILYLYR